MKLLSMKAQSNPVLLSGGFFYQGFGEFEKVTASMVTADFSQVNNTLSGYTNLTLYPVIVSGNQVRIYVEKSTILLSGGAISVGGSGDRISNTFTTLAYGE